MNLHVHISRNQFCVSFFHILRRFFVIYIYIIKAPNNEINKLERYYTC